MKKPDQETVEIVAYVASIFIASYVINRVKTALIRRALQAQ